MGCIFLGPQKNKPICPLRFLRSKEIKIRDFIFFLSATFSLENFYKPEKKTLIEQVLLKPIVSKIDLSCNRKNSINFLKLRQLHKYGITNLIKKFLIYRIATHFKCTFKNKQNKNLFILKNKHENMVFEQKPYFHNYSCMPYPYSLPLCYPVRVQDLRAHDNFFQTQFLLVGAKGNNGLKIEYCNQLYSQVRLHNFATDLTDIFAYIKTNKKKKGLCEAGFASLLKSSILKAHSSRQSFSKRAEGPSSGVLPSKIRLCKKRSEGMTFKISDFNKQTCTPTLLKLNVLKAKRFPLKDSVTTKDSFIETKFLSRFYKNKYTLVRPFLSLTRFDLKKVCNSWKIPLFPDQSNQKLKYQRNRIRKQILPALRFFFNFQIDSTIYQFIEIINSEQEYMDFLTARIVN